MKLIFICNSVNQYNGWSIFSKGLMNSLPKNYEIYLFSSDRPKIFSLKKDSLISAKYYPILGSIASCIDAIKIFINTYNKKIDLIHVSVESFSVVSFILSKLMRAPYTISVAGTFGVVLPKRYPFFKKAYLSADKIIALSNYTKMRMLMETNGLKNIEVINPGIDTNTFKKKSIKKQNRIIFVGNFKTRKGFKYLLESLIILKKKLLEFELIIVTNDNFTPEINEKIIRNKITYKIYRNINEDELCDLYNSSKINVLLSMNDNNNFEGFGLIHYESIACGTLTIGTLNSGNEDAISNANGFLVNHFEVKKISDILFKILTDEYPTMNQSHIRNWGEVGIDYNLIFTKIIK
jgi:glycosyltransferase involved in cell wall biosynthesis